MRPARWGAMAGCVALVLASSLALAQAPPAQMPAYPMKSEVFRPWFDKVISQIEAQFASAPPEAQLQLKSWVDHAKFRASRAMEDGVVTAAEGDYVFNPPQ